MDTDALGGGVRISLARRSIGNTAMMDGNGNCKPLGLATGVAAGGVKTGRGSEAGAATGEKACKGAASSDTVRGVVSASTGAGAGALVESPSSKRRSTPRSNLTNFDLTMFDMSDFATPVVRKICRRLKPSRKLAMTGKITRIQRVLNQRGFTTENQHSLNPLSNAVHF
jgi:hypothetical protein